MHGGRRYLNSSTNLLINTLDRSSYRNKYVYIDIYREILYKIIISSVYLLTNNAKTN